MQREEKQLIDALFQKISQTSAQSGPRDPEAEALINQHLRRIPGAAYYLAQTIIIQRQALKNAYQDAAPGMVDDLFGEDFADDDFDLDDGW